MIKKYIQRILNNGIMIYIIPITLFIIGCIIHYQRGYYQVNLTSLHAQGTDDAYISYRYGWNLTHHGILSWNESGYRRTEGFTNPLWVLTSAVWSLLGRKEWIYPLVVITSVAFSSAFLIFLIKNIMQNNHSSKFSVFGLVFIILTPVLWLHTTSGLESAVFGFGLATLAYLVLFVYWETKPPVFLIVLIVFLGLLRSDAFIYLGIILIGSLIAGSKSWKFLLLGIIVAVLVTITWRQLTYGEWLPNTAVAKINFSFLDRLQWGLSILFAIFASSGLLIILLLGIAGLRISSKRLWMGSSFILIAWMGYFVYIGGDVYLERHLVGLFVLAASFSAPLWVHSSWLSRILLIISMLTGILLSYQRDGGRFTYLQPKTNDPLVMLGEEMAKDRNSYGVVIMFPAGKIPFYAGGDFIDGFGLNDPYLAKIQREQFKPGHSAGSYSAALALAKDHPTKIYSIFTFLDFNLLTGSEDIRLWVDNRTPQDAVQTHVTQEQWEDALEQDDLNIWSIITQPFPIIEIK